MRHPLLLFSGKKLLFQDTFTRADSSTSFGTSNTGQAWTTKAGTVGISSNKAVPIAYSGSTISAMVSPRTYNGVVRGTVNFGTTTTGKTIFLLVRTVDISNHWRVGFSGGQFRIVEDASGTTTVRAGSAFTPSSGTDYLITIAIFGTTISASLMGGPRVSYNAMSTSLTAPGIGVFATNSGTISGEYFDNITFTSK